MAVVSGLQSAPIFRLTKTWAVSDLQADERFGFLLEVKMDSFVFFVVLSKVNITVFFETYIFLSQVFHEACWVVFGYVTAWRLVSAL